MLPEREHNFASHTLFVIQWDDDCLGVKGAALYLLAVSDGIGWDEPVHTIAELTLFLMKLGIA